MAKKITTPEKSYDPHNYSPKGSMMYSLTRQCKIFSIYLSAVYYKAAQESSESLAIMRVLDEQYMRTPFYGAKRLRRLMRTIGWQTVYTVSHVRQDPTQSP